MNEAKFPRVLESGPREKEKKKTIEPSYRLEVDLPFGGKGGTIVNYEDLLRKEKTKQAKKAAAEEAKLRDPFSAPPDADEEELKKIASRYEEKYGRSGKRCRTYADLGAGYDDDDSFIDNTEANEEGVGDDMDTKKGGFYVNMGKLEFTYRQK